MIEIYLKSNTNYKGNGNITLNPTSCIYKDSEKELTLEHFLDEEGRWKYIEYENVIAAEENGKKKLYRIYNVVRSLYSVTAYARPIFYDLADKVLLDVRPTNKLGEEALNIILQDTPFTGHSNLTTVSTSYYIRKNIVEALLSDDENSFLNRWGGEFYCENFDVYINDRIGFDNGVRVEFGYNLNEIEEDVNIENVVTRIIPVGFDGITLDGNSPWVDSQLINKYTQPKMRVITFSDVKVKENSEDEEGFNSIEEAREELIKRCNELYEGGIDKPVVNYKIDMINLANTTAYEDFKMLVNVNKGDTVTCYIPHLDIDVQARVVDFEKDLLTGEYISIELGNTTNDFFKDQADIKNRVDNIFNSNGNVKAESLEGTINALQTRFKALRDVAQQQNVRAILFEDRIEDSPTFGCMCLGTMGFEIASSFKPGTQDWDFRTFGTGKGFVADYIITGILNAALIKAGILKSENETTWINMEDGTFNLANKIKFDGANFNIDLTEENLVTNEEVQSLLNANANSILAKVSNSNKLIAKNAILTGDFTGTTGGATSANWTKNTIGAIPLKYSEDGTNWCNFYTSNTVGELFAYQDVTVEVGKPYEFSCKIAKYSSAAQYYCIRIQEYINSAWVTKKEFTGTVYVDRSNPLVLYTKYKPTVSQVRIWIGKTDGNKFDIYATDFQLFYTADVVKSAELKVLDDKIETKVSESNVGTVIQQNAYSVKIAWNKISNYVQFENGGLSIYNGAVSTSQKRAVFDESGNHFWRDGYYLGKIGTNQYSGDASIKGIVFDLEAAGGYMTWAIKKYSTSSTYSMMWTYANSTIGSYSSGRLHAGCDIDMHNYYLRNVNFEGGGINGTMNFVQIVGMKTDGTVARWYNNCKLVFQNGILVDATWGSV